MCARPLQNRKPQRCVCARVCNHSGFEALDYAVFITSKGEVHIHWVSLWMHQYAFMPCELHLARALGKHGCKCAKVLDRHVLLASKTASYVAVLDHDLLLWQPKHWGRLASCVIDALVRGVYLHASDISSDFASVFASDIASDFGIAAFRSVFRPIYNRERHRSLRLQKRMLGPRSGVFLVQYVFRFSQSSFHVSAVHMGVPKKVAAFSFLMNLGSILLHCLVW